MLRLVHLYSVTRSLSVLTGPTTGRWGLYLERTGYIALKGLRFTSVWACGTPFLLSLLSVHPAIPFQFLPPRGAVVSFLLWSSRLKGRDSPFGRRSNIFRLLNLFARTSEFENRRRPDSFPVGQALRVFWFVCI
jgi:hypothetical protein